MAKDFNRHDANIYLLTFCNYSLSPDDAPRASAPM